MIYDLFARVYLEHARVHVREHGVYLREHFLVLVARLYLFVDVFKRAEDPRRLAYLFKRAAFHHIIVEGRAAESVFAVKYLGRGRFTGRRGL